MRFERTPIDGVVEIQLDVRGDERGAFARTFCEEEFASAGLPFRVVQVNISANSARHTLRGLHFQRAPHGEPKIVFCTRGRIFDVAVDVRPESPTYLCWHALELGEDMASIVYLAEGIAHGFLTLEADSVVHYLMGAPYVPEAADGVRWSDPALVIDWPATPAVVSDRDQAFPLLAYGGGSSGH